MNSHEYYYLAKKNVLPDADFRTRITGHIKKGSRIHVSYICGKAMASIACMLKDLGYKVTGSDDHFYPPMSTVLESHGIKKLEPNEKNLKNVDLIVVGNTSPYNAIEAEVARRKKIPMISGSEAVAQIFSKKRSLVIAGTHGKTTTSALLTHVFIKSGYSPAYMIGGVFQNSKDSYSIGSKKSKYVIYEGDEYNSAFFDRGPKFLRYNPSSIILTSIEHDHFDLYPSFEDYKQAFQFLVDEVPKGGFLVLHDSVLKYIDTKKTMGKVISCNKFSTLITTYSTNVRAIP
jgi:UDP-N-acetylmuramate: L-alanyl-gamma-D-glutamyl-meso-diaminopimelate ligase